jgi:hypothetical protein
LSQTLPRRSEEFLVPETFTRDFSAPKIASMIEPSDERIKSALLTTTYMARDSLSMAERQAETRYDQAVKAIAAADRAAKQVLEGIAFIKTAVALTDMTSHLSAGVVRAGAHLKRAACAAEAAAGHIALVRELVRSGDKRDDGEDKERSKQYTIWRNSAKHARQEIHRALAELAEEFPGAYDVE